jgi:hypothetical protein
MEEAGNGRVHPPPFGRRMNDKWIAFKGKYKPGDELYFFRTNQRSWELTAGREGYVLHPPQPDCGDAVHGMELRKEAENAASDAECRYAKWVNVPDRRRIQ